MLRKYETIFIVKPTLGEDAIKEVVEKFKNFIETSATIDSFDEWGKRKLAYTIQDNTEGYYVLVNFESEPTVPQELERLYKISEDILKFIVIKKDK